MGIKVGGKEVGHSKLGAFAEELGTGLEVRDTAVKVKGMGTFPVWAFGLVEEPT